MYIDFTVALTCKEYAGVDIITSAVTFLLHFGTSSTKKGIFLNLTEPTYKDLLKILPTPKEINRANMIGKKRLTFSVVSSIITAKENDNRVYPAKIAAAPIIA